MAYWTLSEMERQFGGRAEWWYHGITYDRNMSFKYHIDHILLKGFAALKSMTAIRREQKLLVLLYN